MSLDPAKTIFDTALTCWDRTAKYRKYISSLGDNLNALESKADELGCVYDDVNRLVRAAEGEGWAQNSVVDGWLKKAETLKKEAGGILADGKKIVERKCLCGLCCWNCRSRYKQSCLAEAKKVDVEAELAQGRAFRVKEDVAYEPADLILNRSLKALHSKMGELCDVFETVKQRVESEEKRHQVRTPEVAGWLKRVEDLLEKQVREILEEGELAMEESRQSVEGDSSERIFPSSHAISKRAKEKKVILEEKLAEGHGFQVLTCKPDEPLIVELPNENQVGAEAVFKEIWNWVEDETVRCIGLFGMGGVGKTTLLDRVHNQFLQASHDYNFSLRIVVSRPVNMNRIQEAILKKLKLPEDEWIDLDRISRAALILSSMKEKNFLLFLDDLWDPIDLLNDIGVPYGEHLKKCKIIFTTRDEGVCNRMKPYKKKKVECLLPSEALQLFRQKLGEETWGAHPAIPEVASSLVHECKYLPISLVTVARAMAGTRKLKDWMDADRDLKNRVSKFPDMEKRVLMSLEFSYDNLPDETHKACFLYLSIFPEDHEICEDDVIDLWIGEGLLDDCDDNARGYGIQVFRRLRHTCLVEFVKHSLLFGEIVKMHDAVRQMAMWVGSEHGLNANRVLVQEALESFRLEELKKWKDAERLSVWRAGSSLSDSLATISCSNLSTLMIKNTSLCMIPDEFFLSMPCLKVLDLSDNDDLDDLPNSIWKLVNLKYLKLNLCQDRGIIEVPAEIRNLNKLMVLILPRQFLLPVEVISNMSFLRVFYWTSLGLLLGPTGKKEIEILEELQLMSSIEEISVTLVSLEGVEKLFSCSKLPRYTRELGLCECNGMGSFKISTSVVGRLENLQSLTFDSCRMRQIEITGEDKSSDRIPRGCSLAPKPSSFTCLDSFRSLRDVLIFGCKDLTDLTSLIYHAPLLEMLRIEYCSSLKEVIVDNIEDRVVANNRSFTCLTYLRLDFVKSLERICKRALPFPSLTEIRVCCCFRLKELSLNRDSAKALQIIEAEERWWQGLEWDDPASKQAFSTKFVRFDAPRLDTLSSISSDDPTAFR